MVLQVFLREQKNIVDLRIELDFNKYFAGEISVSTPATVTRKSNGKAGLLTGSIKTDFGVKETSTSVFFGAGLSIAPVKNITVNVGVSSRGYFIVEDNSSIFSSDYDVSFRSFDVGVIYRF